MSNIAMLAAGIIMCSISVYIAGWRRGNTDGIAQGRAEGIEASRKRMDGGPWPF